MRSLALALVLVMAGCVQSAAVECADGRVCPPDTRCGPTLCVPSTCGDGVLQDFETCDGDLLHGIDCTALGYYVGEGLACSDECQLDASVCTGGICGDDLVQAPETCDLLPPTAGCGDLGVDVGRVVCAAGCTTDTAQCERVD